MKCKTLTLALFCAGILSATAQNTENQSVENTGFSQFKHQLGLNMSSTIRSTNQRFPGLDYRYAFKPNRALRIQLGFDGFVSNQRGDNESITISQFQNNTNSSVFRQGPNEESTFDLRTGYLFYKPSGDRSSIIFGIEGTFRYHRLEEITTSESLQPGFKRISDQKFRQWSQQYGFSPSIGFCYRFSDRFVFSAEGTFGFFWENKIIKSRNVSKNEFQFNPQSNSTNISTSYSNTKTVNFLFDPFMGLVFGYRL